MEKLQELYDYLKENYENLTADLRIEEFGEIDEEQGLSGQYVCCEQKLIWYDEGYIIACLYNSHPTMKYDTKEEIRDFLKGNNYLEASVLDYKGIVNPIGELNSKAYNDGVYAHFYNSVASNKKHFDLNVVKQILFKPGLVSTITVTHENI